LTNLRRIAEKSAEHGGIPQVEPANLVQKFKDFCSRPVQTRHRQCKPWIPG
jgi:hypothetical protein